MMDATFSISVDAATSVVRIVMAGFFDQTAINRFIAARNEAHRELRCAPNQQVTLVDITDMNIQSRDVVDAFDPGPDNRGGCGPARTVIFADWRNRLASQFQSLFHFALPLGVEPVSIVAIGVRFPKR